MATRTDDAHRVETTVFELAGRDSAGLLAEVTRLLTDNGCDVRSAAVSTVLQHSGAGGGGGGGRALLHAAICSFPLQAQRQLSGCNTRHAWVKFDELDISLTRPGC